MAGTPQDDIDALLDDFLPSEEGETQLPEIDSESESWFEEEYTFRRAHDDDYLVLSQVSSN
ncbi:hypothetical protein GCM10009647_085450 [Streptomyces sanglieri]